MDDFSTVLNLTSRKMMWLIKRLRHCNAYELFLEGEHGSAPSRALPELTSYQMVALCSDLLKRLLMTFLRTRLWRQEGGLLAGSFLREGQRSRNSRVGKGAVVPLVGELEVRHDCDLNLEADRNGGWWWAAEDLSWACNHEELLLRQLDGTRLGAHSCTCYRRQRTSRF